MTDNKQLGEKWTIYWSDYVDNSYVYGTKAEFIAKDEVRVCNELMPPGSEIKTWFSKTNYQLQRIEPTLPIIDGEGEYKLTTNIDVRDGGVLIRMLFFDKYDIEVGQFITRDSEAVFKCPMATYSYRLQLINGGAKEFVFHSIIIQEVLNGSES